MTYSFRLLVLLPLLAVLFALPAQAQRTSGSLGAGAQIGEPTGVTVKIFNEQTPSYDFLAAWSLTGDTSFFTNAHALWNFDINVQNFEQDLEWFAGPGAFIAIEDESVGNDDVGIGVSASVGLNLTLNERVELFVQATPRIALAPDTDGDIGGGLGARYYF